MAWQQVKAVGNGQVTVDADNPELQRLNASQAYKNTLNKEEYTATNHIDIEAGRISVSAQYSKLLPLTDDLMAFKNKLVFNGTKVASFGGENYDWHKAYIVSILYYKDDSNFIIKLHPKDMSQEILLYKAEDKPKTMEKMFADISVKRQQGSKEERTEAFWKYQLTQMDKVVIPKIKFNILNSYNGLVNNSLLMNQQDCVIEKATQQTAFELNEKGAIIEDNGTTEETTAEDPPSPQPKNLIFDKPFLVVLKRTDSTNPYFALWVDNAELLVKE